MRYDTGKLNLNRPAMARRSNGTRTGRSIRTPMTTSPRSASCSTISAAKRPDDGDPGQPSRPDLRPSRPGRLLLRRDRPRGARSSISTRRRRASGQAGSITVHHVRAVHGSATNFSGLERRFLLFQYRAADAWPLLGFKDGIEKFDELLLAGEPTLHPRLAPVPVRLPLPPAGTRARSTRTSAPPAAAISRPRQVQTRSRPRPIRPPFRADIRSELVMSEDIAATAATLDATGLLCPLPVLKARRALKASGAGRGARSARDRSGRGQGFRAFLRYDRLHSARVGTAGRRAAVSPEKAGLRRRSR